MKKLELLLPIFLVLMTGCSKSPDVSYWQDSSYKSAMDFDAEQRYEIKNELASVQLSVEQILQDVESTLPPGESIPDSGNVVNKDITISDDRFNSMVNAIRERILILKDKFGTLTYAEVPLDEPALATVENNNRVDTTTYAYVDIIALATNTGKCTNSDFSSLVPSFTIGLFSLIGFDPQATTDFTIKSEDLDAMILHQQSVALVAKPQ